MKVKLLRLQKNDPSDNHAFADFAILDFKQKIKGCVVIYHPVKKQYKVRMPTLKHPKTKEFYTTVTWDDTATAREFFNSAIESVATTWAFDKWNEKYSHLNQGLRKTS